MTGTNHYNIIFRKHGAKILPIAIPNPVVPRGTLLKQADPEPDQYAT